MAGLYTPWQGSTIPTQKTHSDTQDTFRHIQCVSVCIGLYRFVANATKLQSASRACARGRDSGVKPKSGSAKFKSAQTQIVPVARPKNGDSGLGHLKFRYRENGLGASEVGESPSATNQGGRHGANRRWRQYRSKWVLPDSPKAPLRLTDSPTAQISELRSFTRPAGGAAATQSVGLPLKSSNFMQLGAPKTE